MKKRWLIGAAKYGIGFGLLGYVIWRNWAPDPPALGLAEVLQRPVQVGPLTLAIVLCVVSILITFVRWYVLVRAQGLEITLTNALRLGLVGFFFSTYLPGSVGGDVVKAFAIARQQQRRTVAVSTVIIDRIVGLWGLFWLVVILGSVFWLSGDPGLRDQPRLQYVLLGAFGVVALTLLACLGLYLLPRPLSQRLAEKLQGIPKVGHSAAEFWRAIWMYRDQWRSVLLALGLSLVGHIGFVLTFYYSALVFQDAAEIPTLTQHFLFVPVGMTIQAIFPAPGGVGGGEWGFGTLYALIGKPAANGIIGSLTQRMIFWAVGIVGYLIYLRMPADEVVRLEEAKSPDGTPVENGEALPAPMNNGDAASEQQPRVQALE